MQALCGATGGVARPHACSSGRRRAPAVSTAAGGDVRAAALPSIMGSQERRRVDGSETLEAEAYTPVSSYCSSDPKVATPNQPLAEVLPLFEFFTGLPVLDDKKHVVGVLSEKDVLAYFSQNGKVPTTYDTPVSAVMKHPAITIREDAFVAFAAGLMLQHKVHRLPVVDREGVCVGMLTRSDVFKPLLPNSFKTDPMYTKSMEGAARTVGGITTSNLREALFNLRGK